MKSKRLFSFMTAFIMIFSICTMLPVKVSIPLQTYAVTDVSNLYPIDSTYSLIKSLEGCDLHCFWDVSQWTIGYGNKCPYTHTSDGTYWHQSGGHSISESEAKSLFSSKLSGYVNALKSNCSGLSMTQNQFDALLSATYNHGNVLPNGCKRCGYKEQPLVQYLLGNLTESEAREKYYVWCINAGTDDEKGLRNRRKKEADVFFSGVSDETIVTPTISTDKSSYTAEDTVNISWTASPSGSNLEHYWLKIAAPDGTVIINETMNRNTSYSFVASSSGNYTVTAFATPYNSSNGEGSLTDTKIISVKPKNISYDMSLSETYIELEPDQSKDITLTIRGDFSGGDIGQLNSDTSGCDSIADVSYINGGKASSYIEMTYKVTALSAGSGSCRFYITLDGKTIGSVNLNIVVKVNKCKVRLVDNFRLNTIDEYEIECSTIFNSSQLPYMRKDGYIFEGWYDGNTKYSIGSTVPEVSELRLYAKWTVNDNYSDVNSERYGDINGDGKISAIDTGRLAMYINGTYEFTELEKIYADLDGSGFIDEYDVRILQFLYTYAPGNESIEVLAAKEGWEEKYLYTCHPLLSLKVNGQSSYDAKPGEIVKLTVEVEGADSKYCSVSIHFNYDEELYLSKLKSGTAVKDLSSFYNNYLSYCSLILSGSGNYGNDGVIMETELKIPENVETGKTYLFEFYKDTNDLFTNTLNDSIGKAMQNSAFENWQNCSIRVIGGKGDINSDGKVTISDAVVLKKWLLAVPNAKLENWKSADLYEDGRIDAFDMVEMRKLIVKK